MMPERTKEIIREGEYSIIADYESQNAKLCGFDAEYAIVKAYDKEKKVWSYTVSYAYNMADAFALLGRALGSDLLKCRNELMCEISYDRMSEIATKFKDALLDTADWYEVEECLDELDMKEEEKKYFEIPDEAESEDDYE